MYSVRGKRATRIEPITFSELSITENDSTERTHISKKE
jgi:hypothetical protein